MSMRWYAVHTLSGSEDKAMKALQQRIEQYGLTQRFGRVLVPSEVVVDPKTKRKVTRRFYPGYMLVEMDLDNETWHLVKNTPKVTGFLGTGNKPIPVSQAEVDRILNQVKEGVEHPKPAVTFEIGEQVRVADGPFASFNGLIEEIDEDRSRLKVAVSIFGRATPVELDFGQVEKL